MSLAALGKSAQSQLHYDLGSLPPLLHPGLLPKAPTFVPIMRICAKTALRLLCPAVKYRKQ